MVHVPGQVREVGVRLPGVRLVLPAVGVMSCERGVTAAVAAPGLIGSQRPEQPVDSAHLNLNVEPGHPGR